MASLIPQPLMSRSESVELSSIVSRTETNRSNVEPVVVQRVESQPEPAPTVSNDTNLQAVLICVASFTIVAMACGTLFAFGVYQELYEQFAQEPDNPFTGASPAAIDLIGTLSVSFMTIGAPFATAWTKLFSPKLVIGTGGALFAVASVLASVSNQLWQFEITQGFLLGIATGLAYVPAVTVAPTWYGPRRGLAMGIILAGTGVGGLAWAPAITALVDTFGFRNALRISGVSSGAAIMLAATVMVWDSATRARLDIEHRTRSLPWYRAMWNIPLVDWRIARTRAFAIQLIGASLQSAAYYTPVFFFSTYARTLGFSQASGANFIAVNNACNAVGKIIIGVIADRFGRLNTLFVVTLLSAIVTFSFWLPSNLTNNITASRGLFITYSLTYGIFASPYVSLFPTSLVEVFGPAHFASVNGVLYMARGLASLVGTPTAGALIRTSATSLLPESYLHLTLMVGALLAAASFAVLWLSLEHKRR